MSTVILDDFDIAQLVLYLFWLFFIGLVIYLQKENMREGYPLESEISGKPIMVGPFMPLPKAKTFRLPHGHGDVQMPNIAKEEAEIERQKSLAMRPTAPWSGSPFEPTGNPMIDGVGPAAYALREDIVELNIEGDPRIVPLRAYNDWSIAEEDSDIRGWPVRGCDGKEAGTVTDLWVDRSDSLFRYIEIDLGERSVLCPFFAARVEIQGKYISVDSIAAAQFADVPGRVDDTTITKLEEEKVMAYYAGGKLYGSPERVEPLL
jgi:photosynthetic reaction center H subunit